jgi:hypothetical protein
LAVIGCAMVAACGSPQKRADGSGASNPQAAALSGYREVDSYKSDSPQGMAIVTALKQGDPRALANFSRLRARADSEWAEALDMAVGQALPHNPKGVLALADTPERLNILCAVPFIETEVRVEQAYLREAIMALRSIKEPGELGARRDACEARLQRYVQISGTVQQN